MVKFEKTKKILALALACSFVGSGCLEVNVQTMPLDQKNTATATSSNSDSVVLPKDIEVRNVTYADGRTVTFALAKMSYEKYRFALANDPKNPKTVSQWRQDLGAAMVINGSYFTEDMTPSGFYRTNGKSMGNWPTLDKQHEKNSYTGMVRVRDGRLALIHLVDDPQPQPQDTDQVLLSFPTLVANSKASVENDSQKYARRTALATAADGTTYAIVTQNGAVSLREFSDWLSQQPEKFRVAVNLDGGPSTGMSYGFASSTFEEPSAPIPNVVVAYPQKIE